MIRSLRSLRRFVCYVGRSVRRAWRNAQARPAAPVPLAMLADAPRHAPERLEHDAIEWGTRAGDDASQGRRHADTIDELPGRKLIEETCGLRLTDIDVALAHRTSVLHSETGAAAQHERDATEAHEREAQSLAALDRELHAAPPDRGPHWLIYLPLLALLGLAEYPTVSTALRTFPADATTRRLLAIALSGVLACAAHFLAKTIRAAVDRRDQGRGEARLQLTVAVSSLLAVGGLVVMMAITRGESFKDITELTGGVFGDPELTGWMLFALQVTLLAIAIAAALQHAHGDDARRLRRNGRRARKRERRAKARRDECGITHAALEQQLTDLPELAQAIVATERQLRERVMQLHDAHYAAAASRRPMAPSIPLRGRTKKAA